MAANLAINDNASVIQYTSVGESAFIFPFEILTNAELNVSVDQVDKTLGVDFTVSGIGDEGGGTVTFVAPTTAGEVITIWSDIPIQRLTGFATGAATLLGEDLNTEFAELIRIAKNIERDTGRALRLDVDDPVSNQDMELGLLSLRLGKYLRFNEITGKPEFGTLEVTDTVLTQQSIGQILFPATAAELADGIAIVDYSERPGCFARYFANTSPGVTDATTELQAFFDFVTENDVGTACISGTYAVSGGLLMGTSGAASETQHFMGRMELIATTAIDLMFDMAFTNWIVWNGRIHVQGAPSATSVNFADRTCRAGVKIGSSSNQATKMHIDEIRAWNFYEWGVDLGNNASANWIGKIEVRDCGSGHNSTAAWSLSGNWSNKVNSGTSGSTTQLSVIDVDTLPPDDLEGEIFIYIDGEPHYVSDVDRVAGTLEIFPWVNTGAGASGGFHYMFGGGYYCHGSDVADNKIGLINAFRCGMGMFDAGLYGSHVGIVQTQSCGAGMAWGSSPTAAHLGTGIGQYYFENNNLDIMRGCRDVSGCHIDGEIALDLAEIGTPAYARNNDDTLNSFSMSGLVVQYRGMLVDFQSIGANQLDSDLTQDWNLFWPTERDIIRNQNNLTMTFQVDVDIELNTYWGHGGGRLVVIGSNADGSPTGPITFDVPGGSTWTVNGASSVEFRGFSGAAVFFAYPIIADENILVECLTANPGLRTATTAELADITDAINTDAYKVQGSKVYNTTTDQPVYAAGDTDGAVWNDAVGTLAHTPV